MISVIALSVQIILKNLPVPPPQLMLYHEYSLNDCSVVLILSNGSGVGVESMGSGA